MRTSSKQRGVWAPSTINAIIVVDAEGICRYIDVHQLREVPDEEEIAEELTKLD